MPFAGYKDFADCVKKQIAKGKDKASADKICGSIKHKVEDAKKLEANIMRLEIERDDFIMEITKALIKKVAGKLANKTSPSADDVRALQDLVWMYRSEKRENKLEELTSKARKDLPDSAFVYPKERRYPIHDLAHARNALARSSGKPEEGKVRSAVCKKFPELCKDGGK